ncbi:hypothetical protein C8Q75DRAFT_805319 [Abortiporus biennis]|nr:hypothetical protein C8Q75DRAFT_805319 [Abortiporus biennis]
MHRIAISGRRSTSASGKDRSAKIALVLRSSLCNGAKVDEIIWRRAVKVFDLPYDGEYEVKWHHFLQLSAVPRDAGHPFPLSNPIEVQDTECIIVNGKRGKNSDDIAICTAIQMPDGRTEISPFYILGEVIGKEGAQIKNDLRISAYLVKENGDHIKAGMRLNEAIPSLQTIRNENDQVWTIPTLHISENQNSLFAWNDQNTLYACNNFYSSHVSISESRGQPWIERPATELQPEEGQRQPNGWCRYLSFLSLPFRLLQHSFRN